MAKSGILLYPDERKSFDSNLWARTRMELMRFMFAVTETRVAKAATNMHSARVVSTVQFGLSNILFANC